MGAEYYIITVIEPLLERDGGEVAIAASAKERKSMVAETSPDLVIMDVINAGERGLNAVEDLKADPASASSNRSLRGRETNTSVESIL